MRILFGLEHYLPDSHRHAKEKKESKVGQGSDSQVFQIMAAKFHGQMNITRKNCNG